MTALVGTIITKIPKIKVNDINNRYFNLIYLITILILKLRLVKFTIITNIIGNYLNGS